MGTQWLNKAGFGSQEVATSMEPGFRHKSHSVVNPRGLPEGNSLNLILGVEDCKALEGKWAEETCHPHLVETSLARGSPFHAPARVGLAPNTSPPAPGRAQRRLCI